METLPATMNASRSLEGMLDGVAYPQDRKSTRLNSSHSQISYAVFCLKKKKHDILVFYVDVALALRHGDTLRFCAVLVRVGEDGVELELHLGGGLCSRSSTDCHDMLLP